MAFALWLGVRIVNRRERWAKWTAVLLLVVFVLYPLSSGPTDWLYFHGYLSKPVAEWLGVFYSPSGFFFRNAPRPIQDAYNRYDEFCVTFGDLPRPAPRLRRAKRASPTPDAPRESN